MSLTDSGEHAPTPQPRDLDALRAERDEERALVERVQRGDPDAFDELIYRSDRGVLHLAYRMLRNAEDAQEVYQETFLKVHRYLHKFRFDSSLNTWIYQIATNVCLDRIRRRQRQREAIVDGPCVEGDFAPRETDESATCTPGALENPERMLYGREVGSRIDVAVRTLSERERLVFEMKHYGGLKLKTIGEILKTTEGAAKNYLFRATQKLRSQLAGL